MKKPCQRSRRTSAFTLLELLAVTAILAILAALILGAVARGKMAAHRIACMNNLQQWAQAAHLYAGDNDDSLPRESAVDGINTWEMTAASTNNDVWYNALPETIGVMSMAQYAQTPSSQQDFYSAAKLFHCPKARFSDIAATYPNFSLAINSKLMRDYESTEPTSSTVGGKGRRLAEVTVPDRTALFLDNGIPGEPRLCSFQAPYTGQPKAFASQFPGRHNQRGNIAFIDGHVSTLSGDQVVEMNPASAFRGRAIYPAGEVIWRHDPALVP